MGFEFNANQSDSIWKGILRSAGKEADRILSEEQITLKDGEILNGLPWGYQVESKEEILEIYRKLPPSATSLNFLDVSKVTDMSHLFEDDYRFNMDITTWDVSNVTNMAGMFRNCRCFNQDISNWPIQKVEDFSEMFSGCQLFNQDLSKWKPLSTADKSKMFDGTFFDKKFIPNWYIDK